MLRRKKIEEKIDAMINDTINRRIKMLTAQLHEYKHELEQLQQNIDITISQINKLKKLSDKSISIGELLDILDNLKQSHPEREACIEFVENEIISILSK
ncbi:MAG: hypothetical protein DRN14_03695 [Thermoplasmata archaeon]|nr:MAG: hypothetical protein DRN14_03695 [Thermoplasmata archaeon]